MERNWIQRQFFNLDILPKLISFDPLRFTAIVVFCFLPFIVLTDTKHPQQKQQQQ